MVNEHKINGTFYCFFLDFQLKLKLSSIHQFIFDMSIEYLMKFHLFLISCALFRNCMSFFLFSRLTDSRDREIEREKKAQIKCSSMNRCSC